MSLSSSKVSLLSADEVANVVMYPYIINDEPLFVTVASVAAPFGHRVEHKMFKPHA
jgi:hypothetical protein